jgi:hypothetical protein
MVALARRLRRRNGRVFFDQLISDNPDLGHPDQVSLIFGRKIIRKGKRATPGLLEAAGTTTAEAAGHWHGRWSVTTARSAQNQRCGGLGRGDRPGARDRD